MPKPNPGHFGPNRKAPPGRPIGRPFQKGQSGNPGGAPKGLGRLAREKTKDGKELIEFWWKAMNNPQLDFRHRLEASRLLADRAFGRPVQSHEVSGPEGGPLQIDEYRDRLARKLTEIAERNPEE